MDPENHNLQKPHPSMLTLPAITAAIDSFLHENSKLEIWPPIFELLQIYIPFDGRISTEAQKLVNYYMERTENEQHFLSGIIKQNKELICHFYDIVRSGNKEETIEQILDTGAVDDIMIAKVTLKSVSEPILMEDHPIIWKSIEAVVSCFCLFLEKFKNFGGKQPIQIKRAVWCTLKAKRDLFVKESEMLDQIFSQPVMLMDGFLDSLKPMILNYINMESLLEITSRDFKEKEGLLSWRNKELNNLVSKKVMLSQIFDENCVGREAVEKKIQEIQPGKKSKAEEPWSLLTCISEYEEKVHLIFEKLPRILRAKSNGDMLSFLTFEHFPTFKYQIICPGYIEGPILSDFTKIIFNAGKVPFELVSFPHLENEQLYEEGFSIYQNLQNLKRKYGKIQVKGRNIGVIPANHYYILTFNRNHASSGDFAEILHWDVLPKIQSQVFQSISAIQFKREKDDHYRGIPFQRMLLDYLNHEYLIQDNRGFLKRILTHMQKKIIMEEKQLYQLSKHHEIQFKNLDHDEKQCQKCNSQILNGFCLIQEKHIFCLKCVKNYHPKISSLNASYPILHVRYPLTLVILLLEKNSAPALDHPNKYQSLICGGTFIGSIENEACQGNSDNLGDIKDIPQSKIVDKYFSNCLKNLRVENSEEEVFKLALMEPKNPQEKKKIVQKIQCLMGTVGDKQKLMKRVCSHYDMKNMVKCVMLEIGYEKCD